MQKVDSQHKLGLSDSICVSKVYKLTKSKVIDLNITLYSFGNKIQNWVKYHLLHSFTLLCSKPDNFQPYPNFGQKRIKIL